MLNFVVMTNTPGRLATFLVNRGIIKADPEGGFTGVLPGMEWVRVPNPIQTGVDGSGNPVMDTRNVYLVKFAHESDEADFDQAASLESPLTVTDQWDTSKFAKWVRENSTVVDAPANYTINGEPAGRAYKVNGQNVWLIRDNPERFGVWQ